MKIIGPDDIQDTMLASIRVSYPRLLQPHFGIHVLEPQPTLHLRASHFKDTLCVKAKVELMTVIK